MVIRLVGLLLIALYSVAFLIFLNAIYKYNLMVRRRGMSKYFVYFTQDIFDLFWMVIMWLPLTFFTGIFLTEALVFFPWKLIWRFWLIVAMIGAVSVMGSTEGYNTNNEGKVWSAKLKTLDTTAYRLYTLMEFYHCGLLVLVAVLTLISVFRHITKHWPLSDRIYICSLIASALFFIYFVSNTLSKLTADIKISPNGKKPLLPAPEIALGVFIILLLIIVIIIYLDRARQDESLVLALQYIIGSLVLPLVPVAIQLVQLASPLREQ